MVACFEQGGVDRQFERVRCVRAARAHRHQRHGGRTGLRRPEARRARHQAFDLATGPHRANLLLVAAAVGEHAEFQHGTRSACEVDQHIAVVPYIRHLAAIALVEMVHSLPGRRHHPHRLGAQDKSHQVEEMAAFFDEGSPRGPVEPVPGAHLVQEGVAVFADRQHVDAAGGCFRLDDEFGHRRHVAILHRDPYGCRIACSESPHGVGFVLNDEERLFDHQRQRPRGGDLAQLRGMQMVGACDEDAVELRPGKEFKQRVDKHSARRERCSDGAHWRIRLENRDHVGIRQQRDVAQMLLTHHAASDDAVGNGLVHRKELLA